MSFVGWGMIGCFGLMLGSQGGHLDPHADVSANVEPPTDVPSEVRPTEVPNEDAPTTVRGEPPSETSTSGSPDAIRPPALVSTVEAHYPEGAPDDAGVRVVLKLTIDAEGQVSSAEVVESGGEPFDRAAADAVLQFRFTPATRGGTAVPSQILYAYVFEPSEKGSPDAPTGGSLQGRVSLTGDGESPVAGAMVTLSDGDHEFTLRTDLDGAFAFEQLPPGTYALLVHAEGVGRIEVPVEVTAGSSPQRLVLRLPPEGASVVTVNVRGPSEAQVLRESARAVTVIDTERAKRQTLDLGEVLARTQGIGVQRGGGLGADTRFSLNGLTDDQIRFFLDGIPLDLAGYPSGIADVPVTLVDRVEVYRGVVPTRFGSDALGGAVNLVTEQNLGGTHAFASYLGGSFGTHRAAVGVRHLFPKTGLFLRTTGFFDVAANDYPIDVEVPDERGRLSSARVHRFHDRYRAAGGNVEFGVVDRPWAKRLLLRTFVSGYDKEVQNNIVMTVPYGDAEYRETSTGAVLRYENAFAKRFNVDVLGGYAYGRTRFLDVGECVYDWFGRCVRERRQPGEIEAKARDQLIWDHSTYARVNVGWQIRPRHALLLSLSPTYTTRTGDERRQQDPAARDPLTAERDLFTLVSGLEYDLRLFNERLQNIVFVKDYVQVLAAEEPLPGGVFRELDRKTHEFGVGDSVRFRILDWLYAKASYEWATRLPRPDEVFGNGVMVVANLELEPERSHNANLGLTIDARNTVPGDWRMDVNGFLRDAHQLIVLLGNEKLFMYHNVYGARSAGIEGAAGWTSPKEYVALDGNVTYQSFRNTSSEGTFGTFVGDRIPNRPYLFANAMARVQFSGVATKEDQVALIWNTRYVHEFFRGWESVGLREFKQFVNSQLIHSIALTYVTHGGPVRMSFGAELLNVTDTRAYDFFGVQRPGRAMNFRVTAEF